MAKLSKINNEKVAVLGSSTTKWVDNSVLSITATAGQAITNVTRCIARSYVDSTGIYWLEFAAEIELASAQNDGSFTLAGVTPNNTPFSVFSRSDDTAGPIGYAASAGLSWKNFGTLHEFKQFQGNISLASKPTWFDSNLDTESTIPVATTASYGTNIETKTISATDPAYNSNIDGVSLGHRWVNSTTGEMFILTDATVNNNTWANVGDGSGGILPSYTLSDILVVAGGGGGGSRGGGGAGGLLQAASYSVNPGNVLTVVVGAGGSLSSSGDGGDGGNSSLSTNGGTFTSLNAIGGGGGGFTTGRSGGSGGGGNYSGQAGGAGTAGQGNNGGAGSSSATVSAGGGGGAGSVGADAVGGVSGGAGGSGIADSITGASVTYAGGGGGASETAPGGAAGTGGGGKGAMVGNYNGDPGTANTGGGGGGAYNATWTGGAGGSGVVIIRMPTSRYTGTVSGAPTVTTDGSDTILTFTGSGTYTA